jgi:hypothetical protein
MQIHDLISCFDRVYIVNLPERLDRKQETIAEFKRIGMDVPNERVRFIEATRPDEAGEFPSIGSLGNLISQTRVLRECMELGLDRVAICEDDIKFNTVSPEHQIQHRFARSYGTHSRRHRDQGLEHGVARIFGTEPTTIPAARIGEMGQQYARRLSGRLPPTAGGSSGWGRNVFRRRIQHGAPQGAEYTVLHREPERGGPAGLADRLAPALLLRSG